MLSCAKLCLGDWNRDLRYAFTSLFGTGKGNWGLNWFDFYFTFTLVNMAKYTVTLDCARLYLGDWNRYLRYSTFTFTLVCIDLCSLLLCWTWTNTPSLLTVPSSVLGTGTFTFLFFHFYFGKIWTSKTVKDIFPNVRVRTRSSKHSLSKHWPNIIVDYMFMSPLLYPCNTGISL